jgi:hypothetical protein
MNDLDRKIAELKGWEVSLDGMLIEAHGAKPQDFLNWGDGAGLWSTSDSKALELVDEVQAAEPGSTFNLFGGLGKYDRLPVWVAHFTFWSGTVNTKEGRAATRPEAICRAYIAAREWMAAQGGAGGLGSG